MFLQTLPAATLLACLAAFASASPIARDNDDGRAITWISPDREQYCWQVDKQGNGFASGQTLGVAPCVDSPSQQFIYTSGATSIRLASTSLCVEFGPGLGKNGNPLRLAECRAKGAPGQRLWVTKDDHIALENGPGQCADVRDGRVVDGVGVLQSWRCVKDNTNQIFFGTLPKAIANTIRPSPRKDLCLFAYPTVQPTDPDLPPVQEIGLAFEPCTTLDPASTRFLFPTNNTTVQYLLEPSGRLFTWAQEFNENPFDTGYIDVFLEDPPAEDVLTVTPGQGAYAGLVGFRNAKSGLCVSFLSLAPYGEDEGVPDFVACDEADATQFFEVVPIKEEEHK